MIFLLLNIMRNYNIIHFCFNSEIRKRVLAVRHVAIRLFLYLMLHQFVSYCDYCRLSIAFPLSVCLSVCFLLVFMFVFFSVLFLLFCGFS